jgi:hypothetical protein
LQHSEQNVEQRIRLAAFEREGLRKMFGGIEVNENLRK